METERVIARIKKKRERSRVNDRGTVIERERERARERERERERGRLRVTNRMRERERERPTTKWWEGQSEPRRVEGGDGVFRRIKNFWLLSEGARGDSIFLIESV